MISPLDQLVRQDDFATIIREARPTELVVIALRLEGLDNQKIAALLGISSSAVGHRMRTYQARICTKHPDLACQVRGRKMKPGRQRRIDDIMHLLVTKGDGP